MIIIASILSQHVRAAIYKGENPFCDWQFMLALCLTNILTTSSWPANDAIWRAVFPFYVNEEKNWLMDGHSFLDIGRTFVAALTLAPRERSSWTIFTWPSLNGKKSINIRWAGCRSSRTYFEAKCSAFNPFWTKERRRSNKSSAPEEKWHTALLVLISIDWRRYSRTFSRFPARAARKKPEFPSD